MKCLLIVAVTLTVCGQLFVDSAPFQGQCEDKPEMRNLRDVLKKLESARRQNDRHPDLDNYDMSHVVEVMQKLSQDDFRYVKEDLPLLNALFTAVGKNLSPTKGEDVAKTWWKLCDVECAKNVVRDYMDNRPEDVSSYVAHDLNDKQVERLTNTLLKKSGAEELTDELVHSAMGEFKDLMDDYAKCGKRELKFDLFHLERYVDYFDRLSSRIVSAMWSDYHLRASNTNFAQTFGQQFYEMLHHNGYGIRDGKIVKVEPVSRKFNP